MKSTTMIPANGISEFAMVISIAGTFRPLLVYCYENPLSMEQLKERSLTEERDWIEAARRGDIEGWEHLVETHQQSIFRLAYLLLGDADDAEDIAQETFIHAYRALHRFDPTRPFRPWLMRIATNLCRNWHRRLRRYISALQNGLKNEPQPRS